MTSTTVTTMICDHCKLEISSVERYIDAMVYGVDLHIECFNKMTPLKVVQILGLDDIRVVTQAAPNSTSGVTKSKITWFKEGVL